ncbi:MAG: FKBP-type peptidyl-prolyl cis-trans isomerase [bacterium]|jgi:FKBP-type peptidyl-prolyl cis-trans isomerase SlyD
MRIENNTVARIAYKIHAGNHDGELIEYADESNPRSMIFGHDKVIPGFETHVMGKQAGEPLEFTLHPDQAFGNYRSELVIKVPKQAFMVDGKLREDLLILGNEINMMDNNGNPARGRVVQVNEGDVTMDFNHPLAGKSLFISGKVMSVRAVSEEDLQPKGGCCGGGCGCGSGSEEHAHDHGHDHHHGEDDNCQVCGNPPELQGQGIGDCRCG